MIERIIADLEAAIQELQALKEYIQEGFDKLKRGEFRSPKTAMPKEKELIAIWVSLNQGERVCIEEIARSFKASADKRHALL